MMSTPNIEMRALRSHGFGAPSSVLTVEQLLTPTEVNRDLLVPVKAAAINPSDVKNVEGAFSQTTLPRTPGRDFSGIVATKGEQEGAKGWGTGPGLEVTRACLFGVSTHDVITYAGGLSRDASGQAHLLQVQLDKQLPGTIRAVQAAK